MIHTAKLFMNGRSQAVRLPSSYRFDCKEVYIRKLRATCEKEGKTLSFMDRLIAAHAKAENAVLVTKDRAFYHLSKHLELEDWTNDE